MRLKPTNSSCQGKAVEESGGQTEVLWLALQGSRTSLSTFLALKIIIIKIMIKKNHKMAFRMVTHLISWQVISTLSTLNDESNASLGSIITIASLIILCRCWHCYWLSEIISKLPSKQDQNQHQLNLDISPKVHICSKLNSFKIPTAITSRRRF